MLKIEVEREKRVIGIFLVNIINFKEYKFKFFKFIIHEFF